MQNTISQNPTVKILGIKFANGEVTELVEGGLKGGLIVVPSGPGLAGDLVRSEAYREAVTTADMAVPDSGAMVVFMKLLHRTRVKRVSGLRFLQALLKTEALRTTGSNFWVHPSQNQMERNCDWLEGQGIACQKEDHYIAPIYTNDFIEDAPLIEQLQARQPKVIILSIGGGVQERLGLSIRRQYRQIGLPCPAIVCTGAAIGFLSGNQINIPTWADRLYLGWLLRCIYQPRVFIPRYFKAIPLAYLILKYGSELPPIRSAKI